MRVGAVTLAAAILTACGTPSASAPSVSPSASVGAPTTAATSASPSVVSGSTVRIVVDGIAVQSGSQVTLSGGPTTVILVFPFDMDRASVEPFLPRDSGPSWQDDRTVRLVIPANAANPSFKVAGAMSKDGRRAIEFFVVNLVNPPSMVLSTYTVAELLARPQPPKPDAPRAPSTRGAFVIPSSDSKRVLSAVFGDPPTTPIARVVDIATGTTQLLSLPPNGGVFGGWSGSDAIIVVNDRVWSVRADGTAPRSMADVSSAGAPLAALASPKGTYVAIASKDRLSVLTLASGALRSIATLTLTCGGPRVITPSLAWSPDELRLAASDCAASTGDRVRTRILEPATGATVAIVDGGIYGIKTLLTGDLMVSRESGQTGEGAHQLWPIFSFAGLEKARVLGNAPAVSPDGRYVLDHTCCAGEGFTLAALGAEPDHATQGSAVWLPDGRILVVTR